MVYLPPREYRAVRRCRDVAACRQRVEQAGDAWALMEPDERPQMQRPAPTLESSGERIARQPMTGRDV